MTMIKNIYGIFCQADKIKIFKINILCYFLYQNLMFNKSFPFAGVDFFSFLLCDRWERENSDKNLTRAIVCSCVCACEFFVLS